MTTWTELARAATAAGDEILLRQRGPRHEIRFNGMELMSNLNHQSEGVLAERSLRLFGGAPRRMLIGGLGMGFTLRAALDWLGAEAETEILVCELVPEITAWNLGPLADLAGAPLRDPRVRIHTGCVTEALAANPSGFDVILMDTDNGPDFLAREDNRPIWEATGLARAYSALTEAGLACFWSATISAPFERALSAPAWNWRRDEVSLIPGRVDACHQLYFASREAARLGLRRAA